MITSLDLPARQFIDTKASIDQITRQIREAAERDLSAWLGLTLRPHSSGGKHRVGSISKMGNRHLRRLLWPGAMGVSSARRKAGDQSDWPGRILATKPARVAAVALANRMAPAIRAMLRTGGVRRPV